jgi:hypothetical protein
MTRLYCYLAGILGLSLLGGSMGTLTVPKDKHIALVENLPAELVIRYEAIVKERRNHYIIGLALGFIISFIVSKYIRISNYFYRLSLFLFITLGFSALFYLLMPKSDYMKNQLKTDEEKQKFNEVGKLMKNRYLMGMGLGLLAAVPLASVLC